MKLIESHVNHKFKGVRIIKPITHTDYRGDLFTIWVKGVKCFWLGNNLEFNHDKISTSRTQVLRCIHGDSKSWKLVTCLYGELYFVLVDTREGSKTYMKWDSMILNDKNRNMVLIPPGVGNGFLVMSDGSVFSYKWCYPGKYPDVEDQFTIKWNDERLNIDWPIDNPILQKRDR